GHYDHGLGTVVGQPGAEGTNFYRTAFGYDKGGRVKRVENPNGTITRLRYDAMDRLTETWIGTDDAGFTESSNGTGNMVLVARNEYDNGGIGDGNLTRSIAFLDGSGK